MASKTLTLLSRLLLLLVSLLHNSGHAAAQTPTVVKGAYWFPGSGFPVSSINSALFTHLFCAFADLDPTTYRTTISSSNALQFSSFTQTVQQKNPAVKTLLSIGGGGASPSVFAAMASLASRRKAFIDSSIALARSYNFHGLDLDWESPSTPAQMADFGTLLKEWRTAVAAESRSSGKPALLLTAAVFRSSNYYSVDHPVQQMAASLDWINVMAYDIYGPAWSPSTTDAPAGLFDYSPGKIGVDSGIRAWLASGFPAKKIAFGLPFYGYAWRLVDPNNNGLSAPANGAALSPPVGALTYAQIRSFVSQNTARCVYNSAVVTHYCYSGTTWIGFDDVSSLTTKVSYAKGKGLLGYFAWHVGADSDWLLSQTAFRTWDRNALPDHTLELMSE